MVDYSHIMARTKEQLNLDSDCENINVSFLHYVFPYLESIELELLNDCNEEITANNVKVTGYYINSDENYISVYLSVFDQYANFNQKMTLEQFEDCKISFLNFIRMISDNSYKDINESRPVYDLCDYVANHSNMELIFNLVTNLSVPSAYDKDGNYTEKNKNFGIRTYDISDIVSVLNNSIDDSHTLDLQDRFGQGIKAVKISSDKDVDVYLTSFNGEWLAQLYKEDSVGLLSANVRSYLKRTNPVNREIINTVKDTPQEFVAYNNGLSAIATNVHERVGEDTSFVIIDRLENFLIVNGGQTTATLYECKNDKLDLKEITVPAKISVIKNSSSAEYLIGNISVFSNRQTAIKKSDPPSNMKFYKVFEELSKEIFASKDMVEYHCFFERTNGQYNTLKRMHYLKSDPFISLNPEKAKFTKLQLAQAVVSWEQQPELVCKGQEKNFEFFNSVVSSISVNIIDEFYYKASYALILMYRKMDKLIKKAGLPYKSNLIAHSLAFLSYTCEKKFDLLKIWSEQGTDNETDVLLVQIINDVYEKLIDSPSNYPDIRMWSRKVECWNHVKEINNTYNIPSCEKQWDFFPENNAKIFIDNNLMNVQVWKKLSEWIKLNDVGMSTSQINMIQGMKAIIFKGKISKKQESFAKSIFLLAVEEGFEYNIE